MTALDATQDLAAAMRAIGMQARQAAALLARAPAERKTAALEAAAAAIRADRAAILDANARDLADAGRQSLSAAMLDRLKLDDKRVEAMAQGLDDVAANAAILRGGSESFHSSRAIAAALRGGIAAAGLPEDAVQIVPTRDRAAVGMMLGMTEFIDIIVPRGGRSLIERVQRESRMPVIAHLEGNCHVYVDGAADLDKARSIVLNAKMRRTGVCGAAETLLVDRAVAAQALPPILADLHRAGCEIRGDDAVRALDPQAKVATETDWFTEYLDAILAVRVVDGVGAAIEHVNHYGSHHTDAIVTEDRAAAERFLVEVDSAIVLQNASTQFADGGEFGMGAEIGISTGKLPPRGPVGAEQLTSYKYVIRGTGQVRP